MSGLTSQISRTLFGKNSTKTQTPNFTFIPHATSKGGVAYEIPNGKNPVPTPQVQSNLQSTPDDTAITQPNGKPNLGNIQTAPAMLQSKLKPVRIKI